MAHLFIHHEEDVIFLLQYFHYTFHQKEDTTSKYLSCLFIQLNNQQLIFPAAGIYCPFLSQNTRVAGEACSDLSYSLCSTRYQRLYYLFEPHETR